MKPVARALRSRRHDGLRPNARERRSRGQALVEFALVLPIAVVLLLAVGDLARLYTTMITVESAAREAADLGASGSSGWADENEVDTRAAIEARACVASQNLTGFVGDRTTCTNPKVTTILLEPNGAEATETSVCGSPDRVGGPCRVQVDLEFRFDLLVPFGLDVAGNRYGAPETITFHRTAVFANSDFVLDS